jgi:hypothetical protein
MGIVRQPTRQVHREAPQDCSKECFGTGDTIVIAAFLGTFLLVCAYGLFSFLAKLWN